MRIVYFAKVREAVGRESEDRVVAAGLTVSALLDRMASESDRYAQAFAERGTLRFALDQTMVFGDPILDGVGELAIFPPVTGG